MENTITIVKCGGDEDMDERAWACNVSEVKEGSFGLVWFT